MSQDGTLSARRELAKVRLAELFPEGKAPMAALALKSHFGRTWVTQALVDRETRVLSSSSTTPRRPYTELAPALADPFLPSRREEVVMDYTHQLFGGLHAHLGEAAIARVSDQGWLHREFEVEQHRTAAARQRQAEEDQARGTFLATATARPEGGYGDWYDLPTPSSGSAASLSRAELANVLELAKRSPADGRALEAVCRTLGTVAAAPRCAAVDALLKSDGVEALVRALNLPGGGARLRWRALRALWPITEDSEGARAAGAAGASEAALTAMGCHPGDPSLQGAACAVIANIAKRRADAGTCKIPVGTLEAAASALAKHPLKAEVQLQVCALLRCLAEEDPRQLVSKPGLRRALEGAKALGIGDAAWLLEAVQWTSPAIAEVKSRGSRQRWGQWATGRDHFAE